MHTSAQPPGAWAFFEEFALKMPVPRVDTPVITLFQEARE
jgi:hypothetical protein